MDRILTYTITPQEDGMQVLEFLRSKGFSRHILTSMKPDKEALLVNGMRAGGRSILKEGDHFRVRVMETGSMEGIVPAPLPLDILYEDEDILVLNKPADMPVHPSIGNYTNTLANAAAFYFQQKNELCPFRCINRLDKDTTGITILAKNSLSGGILGRQMNERKIHRTYLAIVRGITPESGTITAPIGRKEGSVLERQVDFGQGEYACTHYFRLAVKEIFPKNTFSREPLSPDALSLIALRLDTGRTHQIRVHMSYLGYPLIGDFLYNPDFSLTKRQALHACQLKFEHPITKEQLCFTAPLPADMQMLFPEFHVPNLDNLFSD